VRPFAEFGDCKILSITCHNSVKGRDIVVELASWFYASQYDKQGYGSLYIYMLVLKQLTSRILIPRDKLFHGTSISYCYRFMFKTV